MSEICPSCDSTTAYGDEELLICKDCGLVYDEAIIDVSEHKTVINPKEIRNDRYAIRTRHVPRG